jgi:hypothetical protein
MFCIILLHPLSCARYSPQYSVYVSVKRDQGVILFPVLDHTVACRQSLNPRHSFLVFSSPRVSHPTPSRHTARKEESQVCFSSTNSCKRTPSITSILDSLLSRVFIILHPSKQPVASGTFVPGRLMFHGLTTSMEQSPSCEAGSCLAS